MPEDIGYSRARIDELLAGLTAGVTAALGADNNYHLTSGSNDFVLQDPGDVGYDLFAIWGQSNAGGGGTDTLDLVYRDVTNSRIKQFPASGPYAGKIVAGIDPLYGVTQSAQVGPGMPFARALLPYMPPNRQILLVPGFEGATGFFPTTNTVDGSTLVTWDPADNTSGKNLYNIGVAQLDAALVAAGPNARVAGILWVQGENDAAHFNQAQYAAAFDRMVDAVRAHFGDPTLPIIIGQMVPDYIATHSNEGPINLAHIDTQRRKPYTAFNPMPTGYAQPASPIHYTADGNTIQGTGMAYQYAVFARANKRGVAPVPPGTITLVQSGTTLKVSWVRVPGRVTDYLVQKDTGSGLSTVARSSPNVDNTATVTGLTLGATVQVAVSTINEEGTSAPTTASLTLAQPPNAVGSLAAGTPTPYAVPLTGTAPTVDGTHDAATGYTIGYKKHTDPTYTTVTTVGLPYTVFGLIPATQYDFTVTPTNGGGNGPTSSVVTVTTAAAVTLADAIAVAPDVAAGLRKLVTAATACVRVRRSSDNTEQDIGFASGTLDLDTAALLTFCGSGDGFVSKLYDQSGNARDFTQATTANQPQIVAGGVLLTTAAGRPRMACTSTSAQYLISSTPILYANGSATVLGVVKNLSTANAGLYCEGGASTFRSEYLTYINSSGTFAELLSDDAAALVVNGTGGPGLGNGAALGTFTVTDSGSAFNFYVNGAQVGGAVSYARAGHTLTLSKATIGAEYKNGGPLNTFNGDICEMVGYKAVLNSTQLTAAAGNQRTYHGTA